jgi:hypothetical protein
MEQGTGNMDYETLFSTAASGLLKEIDIEDAPVGTRVSQTDASCWLISRKYPLDKSKTYSVSGYIRWTGEGNPGTYYATVYEVIS